MKLKVLFLVGLVLVTCLASAEAQRVLSVTDVSPKSIPPGGSATLTITVKNDGEYDASNVVVSWTDPQGAIFPVGTGNTISIGDLGTGDEEDLDFKINTGSDVEPGLYELALTMTYFANNESVEQVANSGLKIGGETYFEIIVSDVDFKKVSLSIINVGSTPAKAVTVKFPKQDGYEPIGSAAKSLGKLASDDYVIVPFDVKVLDGEQKLELELSYTDTDGDRKSVTEKLELEYYEIDVITGANIPPKETDWVKRGFFLASIAAGVGYFVFRRWKKKKRAKNES